MTGCRRTTSRGSCWRPSRRWIGTQAENAARYLTKGRGVAIDGRLDWHEWHSQDGTKRQAIQIADTIQFLGSPPHAPNNQPHNRATGTTISPDDDIPF